MKIFIKVKPKSKEEKVEKIDKNNFIVKVKEAPEKGRANKAVIKNLADYFGVPISKIEIISGKKSKNKVLKIEKASKEN